MVDATAAPTSHHQTIQDLLSVAASERKRLRKNNEDQNGDMKLGITINIIQDDDSDDGDDDDDDDKGKTRCLCQPEESNEMKKVDGLVTFAVPTSYYYVGAASVEDDDQATRSRQPPKKRHKAMAIKEGKLVTEHWMKVCRPLPRPPRLPKPTDIAIAKLTSKMMTPPPPPPSSLAN
jgi:hypothetical protein